MKTFQEFILECELLEAGGFSKLLNPGSVADYTSQNNRTLASIVNNQKRAESSMSPITKIQNSSYLGRVREGLPQNNPKESNNPNYQGSLLGAGSGTKDIMPGTTPSSSPTLPPLGTKYIKGSKSDPNLNRKPVPLSSNRYRNFI